MKHVIAVLLAGVALMPIGVRAEEPAAPHLYYFSGKGGPTYGFVSGIKGENSATNVRDDFAQNVIGSFGVAFGRNWLDRGLPLRTEIEFMNRTEITYDASPLFKPGTPASSLASTVQDVSLMAKGYWHFETDDPQWSPFVSVGLGVARNTVKGLYTAASGAVQKLDNSSYSPAWSVGAGVSFYLGNNVVNDIEIRYVDLGEADWGLAPPNVHAGRVGAGEISFAIRFNF